MMNVLSGLVRRTRQHHAIEHATLHVLSARHPRTSFSGYSDPLGFTIYASDAIHEEQVRRAVGDGAVTDLVIVDGTGPAGEILTVEDWLEALITVSAKETVGFGCRNFAQKNVAPTDLTAVGLQLDRTAGRDGQRAIIVVLHEGVIDNEFLIQPDRDPCADHQDAEMVPFAERFVGEHGRVFAGRAG